MMNLKCAIVDDEPLCVEVIEGFVGKIPNVEVIATFNDAVSAIDFVNSEDIDFLFLDIEMANLNGLDFLRVLTKPPLVIVTTANKEYAIESFELNVVDYVLKPIIFSRLVRAINKVADVVALRQGKMATEKLSNNCLMLKVAKKLVRVNIDDIHYIESDKDYVKVITDTQTVATKQNISVFEQKLNPSKFIRIHRSFIVAFKHISAFSSSSVEVEGVDIPFGRSFREEAIQKLETIFAIK